MESYVVEELYDLVIQQFAVQAERIGIFGHSLQCFFKNMENILVC